VKTRTYKQDTYLIVYDAERIRGPGVQLFDPGYWEQQGAVTGKAAGRGRALLLLTPFGPAVLKQYLRGGWAARLSRDRYVFSGYERSRPIKEFRMLEQLSGAGLPVPEPLAAMCARDGGSYSGWLMTRRIEDVEPLADLVAAHRCEPGVWRETGACIRRFHDFGMVHSDLNARNILVGRDHAVFLIDFDRSHLRKNDEKSYKANLERLHRSLEKFRPESDPDDLDSGWKELLKGYSTEHRDQ